MRGAYTQVSSNLLTAIPVEVSALTALEIFKAKKNKLAVLPSQVSRLQHLKVTAFLVIATRLDITRAD
jgi:hypothetical protein